MASKRKSTTPCMIPLKTLAVDTSTDISEEFKEQSSKQESSELLPLTDLSNSCTEVQENGHQNVDGEKFFCKYCNFGSHDTQRFVEHMVDTHVDFREDPSYVCIACSFLVKDPKELEAHNAECHSGDSNLTWGVAKHESYTVVEQSLADPSTGPDMTDHIPEQGIDECSEIAITKTPIMKIMKSKTETKKIVTIKDNSIHVPNEIEKKTHILSNNGILPLSTLGTNVTSSPIINGSIIGTVPVLQAGVTQLVSINSSQSLLQPKLSTTTIISPILPKSSAQKSQPFTHSQQSITSKNLPKVMIPLSSIPTYNVSMDSNCFLKNSFNKFPYPTKAELCYLTVVTKYPEEQIKIWFTAQRLKQGISWTPEEIEDSRKKMFNTVIQSIPQPMPQPTITVLNAPIVTNANNVQHLIQATLPGQIVGQPQGASGLLVTQPIIPNGIQGANTSVPLAVTPLPSHQTTTHSRSSLSAVSVVGTSRPLASASPSISPSTYDPTSNRCKKSRQQLTALKNSFSKSQFPSHGEVAKLTKITGLSTRDVRKWFSDKRYHWRNKASNAAENSETILDTSADITYSMLKEQEFSYTLPTSVSTTSHSSRRQSSSQNPDFTPTKYKERAPEQIRALEKSFFQSIFPSEDEVNRLRSETKMTRREIDSWFSEKRKRLEEENKKLKIEDPEYDDDDEDDDDDDDDSVDEMVISEDVDSPLPENTVQVLNERKVNPIKINLKDLRVTESSDSTEVASENYNSVGIDEETKAESSPKNRQHPKKTAQQRDILKQMFVQTQWPSNEEYDQLTEQTGLPRSDIVRWFGDCRYSFKNGQLRWYDRYKKYHVDYRSFSYQPLIDYYNLHHMVYDYDIEGLCEKTGLTPDQVRSWFAERLEDDVPAASDTGSDDPHSESGEKAVNQKDAYDMVSEASENSESWEPTTVEPYSNFIQSKLQSSSQLETD